MIECGSHLQHQICYTGKKAKREKMALIKILEKSEIQEGAERRILSTHFEDYYTFIEKKNKKAPGR